MDNKNREREIQRYAQLVDRLSPKSEIGKGLLRAFMVGGLICMIGQGITDIFVYGFRWGAQASSTATSIILILIAALLTGIGVYDRIGKYAGAGSIVPISGFANSVIAPAMEFRRDERVIIGPSRKTI